MIICEEEKITKRVEFSLQNEFTKVSNLLKPTTIIQKYGIFCNNNTKIKNIFVTE